MKHQSVHELDIQMGQLLSLVAHTKQTTDRVSSIRAHICLLLGAEADSLREIPPIQTVMGAQLLLKTMQTVLHIGEELQERGFSWHVTCAIFLPIYQAWRSGSTINQISLSLQSWLESEWWESDFDGTSQEKYCRIIFLRKLLQYRAAITRQNS